MCESQTVGGAVSDVEEGDTRRLLLHLLRGLCQSFDVAPAYARAALSKQIVAVVDRLERAGDEEAGPEGQPT